MSNGGYKGASPARETSPEQYPGVWELTEQFQAQADGNWPFQADDCAPKSLRFNSADQASLETTIPNITTFSFSFWYKHVALTRNDIFVTDSSYGFYFYQHTDGRFKLNNNTTILFESNGYYRDPSAWYHCLLTNDGTTLKLYVNGVLDKAQTLGTFLNSGGIYIGRDRGSSPSNYGDFYLAEANFIDGQALSPEEFGFFDGQGIWQPKRFTGDYASGPVYSNLVTGAHDTNHGWGTTYQTSHMFDGSLTTMAIGQANDTGLTFTPSSPLGANATTIRIYGMDDACPDSHLKINGINYGGLVNSGTGWTVLKGTGAVGSGISSIESIYLRDNSAGNQSYRFAALEIDGAILTDASVGRNSFHIDFSDGVKDQSGVGNDWTANNVGISGDGPASSLAWESGDSGWTIASGGGSATEGGVNGYQDVFTGLLEVGKIYAFTTSHTNGDQNGGWFFADSNSTSLSGTHPNQGRGTNSIGQRGRSSGHSDVDKAGAHGTFATANGVSAGDSNLSGFTIINPEGSDTINWVVDRVKNKVWVKRSSDSAWIQGGNPSDGDSAPSFHLPSTGNLYFGFVQYNNTNFTISIAAYSFTASGRASDIFVDSPVNGNEASTGAGNERRGNYATLNPLQNATGETFSDGNLKVVTNSSNYGTHTSTMATPLTGKWYAEVTVGSSTTYSAIGLAAIDSTFTSTSWLGSLNGVAYYSQLQKVYLDSVASSYGTAYGNGDVIGIAYDADNGTVVFYKNGVSQGTVSSVPVRNYYFANCHFDASSSATYYWNFGQRAFKHPVSGYSPLATSFLPEPTIKRGDEAVDVVIYDGTTSPQKITGTRFASDLIWIKSRTHTGWHILQDSVRGFGKTLFANSTNAEVGNANDLISDVSETGFSVNTNYNGSTDTATTTTSGSNSYCAWVWDAGESTTTIAAGGLNSSAYNQSQAWSSNVTGGASAYGAAANAFDSSLSTYASPEYSSPMTYTNPSASDTVISTFRIYTNIYTTSGITLELNDTDIVSQMSTGAGWQTVTGFSGQNFSKLYWRPTSGNYEVRIHAIEINGQVLANGINDSQTWSNSLTGLSGSSLTNPPNAFDADESSYADSTAGFTLDLSGHTFGTGAHTIEVKSGGATSFSVNGSTSLTDPGGGGAKVWTGTHTGELTSLASSATGASLYYLKIDGILLVNPGQNFVTNVPSIATTVRARPETGFSIAKYTGTGANATIAHGLSNAAPEFIIVKMRSSSGYDWCVYHKDLTSAAYAVSLHSTTAEASEPTTWNSTAPTKSAISLGTRGSVNNNGSDFIAYSWTSIEGYSSIGSFQNPSSTEGAFVFCGFKPKLIIAKCVKNISSSSGSGDWIIKDTTRSPFNNPSDGNTLVANVTNSEDNYYNASQAAVDILSNGFKIRHPNSSPLGDPGRLYIYAAWAENPFASQARAV